MKNMIVVLATCLFLAFATQAVAQDCSHGRCNPSRPVAKLAQKLKQSPVMNLQLKFNYKTKRNWEALRPRNWFNRNKKWGCR